jgi:uncharacterized membrane protein
MICHQRPERSFMTGTAQWPVCGRCAGLYLSAALAVVACAITGGTYLRSPTSAPRVWRATLVAAALPTALSWLIEYAGWWMPTSATRAWLAVPLGAAIGALLARLALERQDVPKT